jgi:hypothetical protein
MEAFVFGGGIVDLIIVLMLLEGVWLVVHHHRTGRGIPPRDAAMILASGLSLLLALRAALAPTGWAWIVAFLCAAGLLHAADLWQRWR